MTTDIEQRVKVLEMRVDELEEEMSGSSIVKSSSDVEGFLEAVSPDTHVERATTIGFYLVHEQNQSPFTVEDVERGYEIARIPKPANLSDVLAGAEEKDWVMRAGTEGQHQLWTVTQEGDAAVEKGFQ